MKAPQQRGGRWGGGADNKWNGPFQNTFLREQPFNSGRIKENSAYSFEESVLHLNSLSHGGSRGERRFGGKDVSKSKQPSVYLTSRKLCAARP